jgi:uncharacterized protein (TIGR00251 family)
VLLTVRVTAKAKRAEVTGIGHQPDGNKYLIVKVRAAPTKGKANSEVIETVAKTFGVAKSTVRIIAGETTRNKRLLITGNPEVLLADITDRLKQVFEEAK